MGKGWAAAPEFILLENSLEEGAMGAEEHLRGAIAAHPKPFDFWMIGGSGEPIAEEGSAVELSNVNCELAPDGKGNRGSFGFNPLRLCRYSQIMINRF